jgi:proline iminopeptidase
MTVEPFDSGLLAVGDGQQLYYECWGNPEGRPAVYLHGGPGSGSGPNTRRLFDPSLYKIVLYDQRGCGRSVPLVRTEEDLRVNTTQHLIDDLERLREHLNIDRWTIVGGSWGTTLGLAYAQAHPERVAAAVFACITTTSCGEVDWITNGMRRFFPAEWERFASWFDANREPSERVVDAYARLLFDPDERLQARAAREWCTWEDTHVSLAPGFAPNRRFDDPDFRLRFARLVTHYWRNAAFLPDGHLLRNACALDGVPGILIHGRYDISSPVETAWTVHRAWHGSELKIVEDSGHGGTEMSNCIVESLRDIARVTES